MKVNNFILTGFDRSGTSAISRTLSMHPQVELVFRPFNGGSIREKMYQILSNDNVSDADVKFFAALSKGCFDSSYLKSWWHEKFSTVKDEFVDGHLHLLITNLNHFTLPWLSQEYPNIENWAIWREPLDIIQSCVENNFLGDWYQDALLNVHETVKGDEFLRENFGRYEGILDDDVKKIAYLLAVRNTYLFQNVGAGKFVDYDLFKVDPNNALRAILEYFELDLSFDFSPMLGQDLNSVPGAQKYSPGKVKEYTFSTDQRAFIDEIIVPLRDLYQRKKL